MANTPNPSGGQNIDSMVVPSKKGAPYQGGSKASYTPSSSINEQAYGKDGGKANVQSGNIPSVEANGSVVGELPAMPGTLVIGDDKNVSTPVSG